MAWAAPGGQIGNEEEPSPMTSTAIEHPPLVRTRAGEDVELAFVLDGDPGSAPWSLEIRGIRPATEPVRLPLGEEIPPEPCRVDLRFPAPPTPGLYVAALRDGEGRPLGTARLEVRGTTPALPAIEPGTDRVASSRSPGEDVSVETLLTRVGAFDSSFFNERYTPEKARRRLREMIEATRDRRPFSLVRLGDNEVRLLGYGLVPIGERTLAEEAAHLRLHTGVDPLALTLEGLRRLQDEFLATAREADVLATHRFTVNADWHEEAERVLGHLGLPYGDREVDVAWNAEILDRGFLLPLLGMGRVLLIGNPAPKWARLLADPAYRERYALVGMPRDEIDLAGAIFVPHEGTAAFDRLEGLWDEVRRHEFDLALVAASVVGKLLVGRIRRDLGKVALDIGWNMQFLADCSSPVGSARQLGRRGFRNLFRGRGEPGGLPPDGPRDI